MIIQVDSKQLAQAYEMLCEIEVGLKNLYATHIIYSNNSQLNIHKFTYFQLIHNISDNSSVSSFFTQDQLNQLLHLRSIRNKVCHMRPITRMELSKIRSCHLIVKTISKDLNQRNQFHFETCKLQKHNRI